MQRILRLEDQVTELEEQISQLYEERARRKANRENCTSDNK